MTFSPSLAQEKMTWARKMDGGTKWLVVRCVSAWKRSDWKQMTVSFWALILYSLILFFVVVAFVSDGICCS